MALHLSEEVRRKILDPAPGSALARARDYGIDLTLVLRNIGLTGDELLEQMVRARALIDVAREIREGGARE